MYDAKVEAVSLSGDGEIIGVMRFTRVFILRWNIYHLFTIIAERISLINYRQLILLVIKGWQKLVESVYFIYAVYI